MQPAKYKTTKQVHLCPPIWEPSIPILDGKVAISFIELMELKIVRALIEKRDENNRRYFGRRKIRFLVESWRGFSKDIPHPLVNKAFEPGLFRKKLVARYGDICIQVEDYQYVMNQVVPVERLDIDYQDGNLPLAWYPMNPNRSVLLSPRFSFGAPILAESFIPTSVIARTNDIEPDLSIIARNFAISVNAVEAAIEFEKSFMRRKVA